VAAGTSTPLKAPLPPPLGLVGLVATSVSLLVARSPRAASAWSSAFAPPTLYLSFRRVASTSARSLA
jgi:hypothetical protein